MTAIVKLSRREVLRGVLGGTAVTVGLPLLECFLNSNGTAYAATGAPLTPCFATYYFGLGFQPGFWRPAATGNKYTLPEHISCLGPIQAKMNLFSGMQIFLDGKANQNHYSNAQGQMTGIVSRTNSEYTTSIDTIIGDQIGKRSRFRSLEVSCDGDRKATWSARGSNGMNPSEISPLALYARIFGPEFKDPNAADFVPDPMDMARRSVLSGISEQRTAFMRKVSASDRARLEEYFSSVRDLEQSVSVQLEKPAPLPACSIPKKSPEVESLGMLVDQVRTTNRQFALLLAHALSCGQTQVVNVTSVSAFSALRYPGETTGYHQLTHEEPIDPKLGYQIKCKQYAEQQISFFVDFVQTLDSIREGDGTLLDRTVVFAFSDHGDAKTHSMKDLPILTAGSGGGRMKTGFHLAAEGDAATRVGLTIQQALGIRGSGSWGTETNHVTKPFSEVLA
jgi:hypothetical protein